MTYRAANPGGFAGMVLTQGATVALGLMVLGGAWTASLVSAWLAAFGLRVWLAARLLQ